MYREMRRKDRQGTKEDAVAILIKGEYGTLATVDKDNIPYAIPLSYAYTDNCIYVHCAKNGHKLDNIRANPNVSFCVVTDTEVLPKEFSTNYKSAVVFGKAAIVENKEDKIKGLQALIKKYSPDFIKEGDEYINRAYDATCVFKIDIEHITGKMRLGN